MVDYNLSFADAEKDVDPVEEVDVESLRFGSYQEVNYGRGCRALRTEQSGKDLFVVFDGKKVVLQQMNLLPN